MPVATKLSKLIKKYSRYKAMIIDNLGYIRLSCTFPATVAPQNR